MSGIYLFHVKVSIKVYMSYCKALGFLLAVFLLLTFLVFQAASVGSNIWLSRWTEDPYLKNSSLANTTTFTHRRDLYLGIYGALGFAQGEVSRFFVPPLNAESPSGCLSSFQHSSSCCMPWSLLSVKWEQQLSSTRTCCITSCAPPCLSLTRLPSDASSTDSRETWRPLTTSSPSSFAVGWTPSSQWSPQSSSSVTQPPSSSLSSYHLSSFTTLSK